MISDWFLLLPFVVYELKAVFHWFQNTFWKKICWHCRVLESLTMSVLTEEIMFSRKGLFVQNKGWGSSPHGSVVVNPTSIYETRVWSLASLNGLRIWHCYELWFRSQTQLWSGIAMAVAQASSYNSDSTRSLGISVCRKCGLKKIKKNQEEFFKICYFII